MQKNGMISTKNNGRSFLLLLSIIFICGICMQQVNAQDIAPYCATREELQAVFADAEQNQSGSFSFQCSDDLLGAIAADGSDLIYRAQYEHNMLNSSITYYDTGLFEVSEVTYGNIYCADCGTPEDISNALSAYIQEQNSPELLVLFVDADYFQKLLDGSQMGTLAIKAGFEDYELRYMEGPHLFLMSNIKYKEADESAPASVSNDDEFRLAVSHYARAGVEDLSIFFTPEYFSELRAQPERLDTLMVSSMMDSYSWLVNEEEAYIQLGDVTWLVAPIPYTYVNNEEEYAAAINDYADRKVSRFTILFQKDFYERLMNDQEFLRKMQLSTRLDTYGYVSNDDFHYIKYSHVSFAEVPSHFCGSAEEFAEYLQTIAAETAGADAVSANYRISFDEALYNELMGNGNEKLHVIEEQAGLINYGTMYYNDSSYTITYEAPEFADKVVSLGSLEEADAYFAELPMDADPKQVLHCTKDLYQLLLTDEKANSIDHTRLARLDDILAAHGIVVGGYSIDEKRNYIILEGCSYYPGMRIIYALENDMTDILSERERQTMEAASAFAQDAITQTLAEGEGPDSGEGLSTDRQLQVATYIHDRLCRGIQYTVDESVDEDDTAIGALLNGEANCDGYADAFYLVGSLAGLTVTYQHGESLDDEDNYWKDETHLWNLLQLDGTWRLVDVTWDDSEQNGIEYTWFNIGLDRASRTHNWNQEGGMQLLPQTDLSARPENEYAVNSVEEAREAINEATGNYREFYIYFENEEAASHYEELLEGIGLTWTNGFSYSWNQSMLMLRAYAN